MPALLPPTHAHTYMCIKNNCTPTLCSVRNLLSVSTHQNVLRWHWAEHFLNANNVICCAWLSNELGNWHHCTQTHALQLLAFLHLPLSSTMQIHFTLWSFLWNAQHTYSIYTLEPPFEKEIVIKTNTRSLFSQLTVSQPHHPLSSLMLPRLSHVRLDKLLTAPLWRDLLSYLTFATIKHHPCLVEKLECVI